MERLIKLDYVWLGGEGTQNLRTKVRYEVIDVENPQQAPTPDELFSQIPEWSYDGSSTEQAETENSDLIIRPVKIFGNAFQANRGRGVPAYFVFCEVFNQDGTPHESNERAKLREVLDSVDPENDQQPIFGIEQEYVFWDPENDIPSGWKWNEEESMGESPSVDGSYYCGVGGDSILHRQLAESHTELCLQTNIPMAGFNSEVMKSQWEYQLQPLPALDAADCLWMSRFVLERIAETRGLGVNLDPKPVEGWNGSGGHINISTTKTREGTMDDVEQLCKDLGESHDDLISVYGEDNNKRLTGEFETSSIESFSYGQSDRTTSVRIPLITINNDSGHVEDRRPASNMNPYTALKTLVQTLNGELVKV